MASNFYKKTKKGALTSSIVDFWSFVALVFIIIIFYPFFTNASKKAGDNKIIGADFQINPDLNLLNYLRTPYTLNGNQITMADLIVIYYNENDKSKKKFYYDEILKKTKEIFNPMEYCVIREGRTDKDVNGYAVYILDKASYLDNAEFNKNYKGTKQNDDMKFRSDNFFDGLIAEKSLGVLPSNTPDRIIYIGFFVSSANAFGRQVSNIGGCV